MPDTAKCPALLRQKVKSGVPPRFDPLFSGIAKRIIRRITNKDDSTAATKHPSLHSIAQEYFISLFQRNFGNKNSTNFCWNYFKQYDDQTGPEHPASSIPYFTASCIQFAESM
ncbi:hypothetical protein [Pseudochelatococcus contaminans]|uniref:hypothetical protein n=1 Tax=Pseudochelatococcus contaminans TaxID=1538103 RepID=UPI001AED41BA|nr:hypothetical protein [Pseudochelatococcus contaminans]